MKASIIYSGVDLTIYDQFTRIADDDTKLTAEVEFNRNTHG
jgi:hypothetical protein